MKFTCPLIVVKSIEKSRKFYEDVLGQKVVLDYGENITFDGDFSLQSSSSWQKFIDKNDEITYEKESTSLLKLGTWRRFNYKLLYVFFNTRKVYSDIV